MEPVSSSYNITFVDGPQSVYLFESRFGASYEVKFKPGPELVDDPDLEDYIFELVIVLADNPYAPKLPPADALMSSASAVRYDCPNRNRFFYHPRTCFCVRMR